MRRANSLEKDLDAKGGGGRGWDDYIQLASATQ